MKKETQFFDNFTKNSRYIQIYNYINDAILNGDYKIGDKLPSEKEFCAMFNVSRVPVREAICALELNGLVSSISGCGVYVKKRPSQIDSGWMYQVDLQEIIRARIVLEPNIARDAALNIKSSEKQRLFRISEQFNVSSEVDIETNTDDREFHLCIAKASDSILYEMLMNIIFKTMDVNLTLSRTVYSDKYRQQNIEDHYCIGRAIIDGRADDAYTFMKDHMYRLYEHYWE